MFAVRSGMGDIVGGGTWGAAGGDGMWRKFFVAVASL